MQEADEACACMSAARRGHSACCCCSSFQDKVWSPIYCSNSQQFSVIFCSAAPKFSIINSFFKKRSINEHRHYSPTSRALSSSPALPSSSPPVAAPNAHPWPAWKPACPPCTRRSPEIQRRPLSLRSPLHHCDTSSTPLRRRFFFSPPCNAQPTPPGQHG